MHGFGGEGCSGNIHLDSNKSSIVAQVAQENNLEFIDLRLSQLAPTDLRGLPVAIPDTKTDKTKGISTWYPPEFLPRGGKGILFLDELNMAPPAMQGVAQQLILDRQVGAYEVPEGWFIWAAGNRKEDRASVFEMPAPLANRFLHLEVAADFDSFKAYALEQGFHEQIIAFLSFRSKLLHEYNPTSYAWPSPRSWEMANRLHRMNMDITPAVGEGAAAELRAYIRHYSSLPDLNLILEGKGGDILFDKEPSVRYAITIGLTVRIKNGKQAYNSLAWLADKATAEWINLLLKDLLPRMKKEQQLGVFAALAAKNSKLAQYLKDFHQLMGYL